MIKSATKGIVFGMCVLVFAFSVTRLDSIVGEYIRLSPGYDHDVFLSTFLLGLLSVKGFESIYERLILKSRK